MKIYLKNYSIFGSFLVHNFETGETNETENVENLILSGFAERLCQSHIGFFEYKNDIYFFVSDERFKLNEKSQFEHQPLGKTRKLTLIIDKSVKKVIEYKIPELLEDDFTPFVEEEDFDFGLFLKNIFSDKERISRVLKELTSNND